MALVQSSHCSANKASNNLQAAIAACWYNYFSQFINKKSLAYITFDVKT